jgi:hypothetical protein
LCEFAPNARRIAALADVSTISTHVQLESVARKRGTKPR